MAFAVRRTEPNPSIENLDVADLGASAARWIRIAALSLGFDAAGIAPADTPQTAGAFDRWLAEGLHGDLGYMERTAATRRSLREWAPWAECVIMVAARYCVIEQEQPSDRARFAGYALGLDYHDWFRKRLIRLGRLLSNILGRTVQWKPFCDTAPVLERSYAAHAGIGWIGRNTMIIHPVLGSYLLIGGIAIDVGIETDSPVKDACGTCRRCIDACPTMAILHPYKLDARRCISYHTIETPDPIPEEVAAVMENRVFGCDICQEVCPMNRMQPAHGPGYRGTIEPAFQPHGERRTMTMEELAALTPERYRAIFRRSAMERAGREGLTRNAQAARDSQANRTMARPNGPPEAEAARRTDP